MNDHEININSACFGNCTNRYIYSIDLPLRDVRKIWLPRLPKLSVLVCRMQTGLEDLHIISEVTSSSRWLWRASRLTSFPFNASQFAEEPNLRSWVTPGLYVGDRDSEEVSSTWLDFPGKGHVIDREDFWVCRDCGHVEEVWEGRLRQPVTHGLLPSPTAARRCDFSANATLRPAVTSLINVYMRGKGNQRRKWFFRV